MKSPLAWKLQDGVDLINDMSNIWSLPLAPSIEYWWSFVPIFAAAPSVLWRQCTFDE
jgi:hypothetical protein